MKENAPYFMEWFLTLAMHSNYVVNFEENKKQKQGCGFFVLAMMKNQGLHSTFLSKQLEIGQSM